MPAYNENVFMEHFRVSRNLVDRLSENSAYYLVVVQKDILIFIGLLSIKLSRLPMSPILLKILRSCLSNIINRCTNFLSEISREVI